MACLQLDRELIAQIRLIEHATGQYGMLSEFIRRLEGNLAGALAGHHSIANRGDGAHRRVTETAHQIRPG